MNKLIGSFLLFLLFNNGLSAQSPTFSWAKTYGNSHIDDLKTVKSDAFGNVFYAGTFLDSVDFDPGPGITKLGSSGGATFIVKLDVNGIFKWVKQLSASFSNLEIDKENNVIITGSFTGICDFDALDLLLDDLV